MGVNIISGCHKCRVRKFHFRNKEAGTVPQFYRDHYECMKENPANIETKEDQLQEEPWMREYTEEESSENITPHYLMTLHPELTSEGAISLCEFSISRTIKHKSCYGDGSIMYPKWKASIDSK